eukprot:7080821-Lingulodinium_polyedra.AAC.1
MKFVRGLQYCPGPSKDIRFQGWNIAQNRASPMESGSCSSDRGLQYCPGVGRSGWTSARGLQDRPSSNSEAGAMPVGCQSGQQGE